MGCWVVRFVGCRLPFVVYRFMVPRANFSFVGLVLGTCDLHTVVESGADPRVVPAGFMVQRLRAGSSRWRSGTRYSAATVRFSYPYHALLIPLTTV
ncbi:hypothetical protein DENSPDRAFT_345534 [Dentipellis sp. KUC8613]|nr:hypothetical protein DENSPDRAFT_345534 [Dentipellis sp. KUC8613]